MPLSISTLHELLLYSHSKIKNAKIVGHFENGYNAILSSEVFRLNSIVLRLILKALRLNAIVAKTYLHCI